MSLELSLTLARALMSTLQAHLSQSKLLATLILSLNPCSTPPTSNFTNMTTYLDLNSQLFHAHLGWFAANQLKCCSLSPKKMLHFHLFNQPLSDLFNMIVQLRSILVF
jgi:hypothetical protein